MSSASSSKRVTPDLLGSPPSGLLPQLPSRTDFASGGEASDQDVPRALDGLARAIETDAHRDPCGYLQRTNTHQHGE